MPIGDDKHKLIYEELVNVLGEEHVEDDPAIVEAFYRDALTPSYVCRGRFEFIVLPGSTEDVQNVMRLANRYQFPVSITGSGQSMNSCNAVPGYPYWCLLDPKRMNTLQVDGKNMSAVVQPHVTVAQLQAEAMQHGLFHGVTGASTQGSVVGTNMFQSIHWTGWRTGVGRNLLGVEWVLPNGDLFQTGSLAVPEAGWFWGEGPGPDSRGILRGHVGHFGSLGLITKIAVKLYPWPGPRVWPTEGVQPEKTAPLPADRFKCFTISFPSLEQSVHAVAAMGRAEICAWVMKYTAWDFVCWYARSFEEFWQEWNGDFWTKQRKDGFLLACGIWGYATERQVQYEEKVLRHIAAEFGGTLLPDEIQEKISACLLPNTVRDTHRPRFTRLGRVGLTGCTMDSLYDTLRNGPPDVALRDKYTPPLGYMGPDIKFWPFDFGHQAWTEIDSIAEKSHEYEEMLETKIGPDMVRLAFAEDAAPTLTVAMLHVMGPRYGNIHVLFGKIKKALDPLNVANPTRILDMAEFERADQSGDFKPIF